MSAQQWRRWGRGFGAGAGQAMGAGGGFGSRAGWAGPWPGAGPFSYLPPWQRPGWVYGRGAIAWNAPQGPSHAQQGALPPAQQGFPIPYHGRPVAPIGLQAPFARPPAHMDCAYFNGGICALRGMPIPANGTACPSFAPRIQPL
ncbi:MAG: hypothetical protein QXU06_02620 [Candidatus Bathyarchaeia archaeon]